MAEKTIPFETATPQTSRKIDRRAWVRFPKNEVVWCEPVSASAKPELDTAWMGRVRDISRGGIGLSLRQRFEPGTALIVELSERPKILRHLLVHVVHATAGQSGRWTIGCTFDDPLSAEELRIFLQEEHAEP
jgi:c-di-GMP-binding flagellar brake protein YcgR